jgi:cellulose biosynthesis protein BcsQ
LENQTHNLTDINRLMVFNPKGGVGKTAIALNLALTYGHGIVTNDRLSIIDEILPPDRCLILEKEQDILEIPFEWPLIFDFGGYPDARVQTALATSRFILMPVLPHKENIQTNLNSLEEILQYKPLENVGLIVNQTSGKQFEVVSNVFRHFYPELAIFEMKKSTAFSHMVAHTTSIEQVALHYKMYRRHFQPVAEMFEAIVDYISLKTKMKGKKYVGIYEKGMAVER